MSNLRQAAQQALEALWYYHATEFSKDTHAGKAIAVLQAALAEDALQRLTDVQQEMEAQQEPICPDCKAALLYECVACSRNNYPPQRKPLTDEEINALELPPSGTATVRDLVRLIEAKQNERNT
jgi:hypothetical protein